MRGSIHRFDHYFDDAFDQLRGRPWADWLFYVASETADYSKLWHAIGASLALVDPSRRRHAARLAVTLGVESILVNGILKQVTSRERPALLEGASYEVRRPKTGSFPSGHASSAAVAAVLLSEAAPRLRPVWVALSVAVAASRIHNRMHHGSDVAAGSVLGVAIGLTAKRIWPLR